jgi:hypothetical protein
MNDVASVSLVSAVDVVIARAIHALGPDLSGGSVTDLCADQIAGPSLSTLQAAIALSVHFKTLSPRVQTGFQDARHRSAVRL